MSIEKARAEVENSAAYKRLVSLFDDGEFAQLMPFAASASGRAEAVAASGTVNGCEVYAFAQSSDMCGGAMSKAQADKLAKLYALALKTGTPVIGVYDSVGARIDEGIDMMTSYSEVVGASGKLAGVVPQIAVVLGPCLGTAAVMAACADFVIMSDGAQLSVNTNGKGGSLDENKKHGVCAVAAKDEFSALEAARQLVAMLPQNNLSDAYETDEVPPVQGKDIISAFADGGSFMELYEGYADGVTVGLARVQGDVVGVVEMSGGLLDRRACEKCAKLVRFCDAFSVPVVTLADAEGFSCVKSASKLTASYAEATTAKITVVTGKAYGAFYLATAGKSAADITIALDGASVSAIAPEAGIIILKPELLKTDADGRKQALDEFAKNECGALRAAEKGYVDSIATKDELRKAVADALDMLSGKREATLPKKHSTI